MSSSSQATTERWREELPPAMYDRLVQLLRAIYQNDETKHYHHEPRSWDGLKPTEAPGGGTCFRTPREISEQALKTLGEPLPTVTESLRQVRDKEIK